jgi:hypothetical protein
MFDCRGGSPGDTGPYVLHEKIPRHIHGVLFGDTLALVLVGHGRSFFDELVIRHPKVIGIMNQGREENGKLCQRIRRNTKSVIVEFRSNFLAGLLGLFGILLEQCVFLCCYHTLQELVDRHDHMRGMLKVMKGILTVHGPNNRHVTLQLRHDLGIQLD